jgi:hypothetical protein
MKGRFLIIVCLLATLSAMGQNRKSPASSNSPTSGAQKDAATATDSLSGQGASESKIEEITPDQVDNFCSVLLQLMDDAAGNFERIRGKVIETVSNNTLYTSNGGIPGTITSSLIHSPSRWQYEGVLYQGNSKEEMQTVFDKNKRSLDNCLPAKGYRTGRNKNSSSKLEDFPEYNYSKADDDGGSSSARDGKHNNPPHATLNVDYTAGTDIYVLTLNIWSN